MAVVATNTLPLPHPTILCPPPLQLQERPRRATIRRRILRKATQSHKPTGRGPLDDIIAEIKNNIRESPSEYTDDPPLFEWIHPLKAPSTWATTLLPASRAPSDQPLTVRKNRNSRSSASGSSMGDTANSRKDVRDEAGGSRTVGIPPPTDAIIALPSLCGDMLHTSDNVSYDTSANTYTEYAAAHQALRDVFDRGDDHANATVPQRRPSRLRTLTNAFPRLRRAGTGDTTVSSTGEPLDFIPPTAMATSSIGLQGGDELHKCCGMVKRMASRLPITADMEPELQDDHLSEAAFMPTLVQPSIRICPEFKLLTEHVQDFTIAIEIEGVLHNRTKLSCATLDVVFIVDNGYYVTKECLEKATEAVNGALYHMQRGDRLALYTTHCTHNPITGNRPEEHYTLQPLVADSEDLVQDLTTSICRSGTQTWMPVRPNPSMSDVVLSVVRSLGDKLKQGRTHMMLLSPAAYVLHGVSETFPDLAIHRINPAVLPYHREPDLQNTVCLEACCKNVFVSNSTSYQSVPGCIKRILKNARCNDPIGELTDVSIDIRVKDGCELIECIGSKDVPQLRLGQLHTIFANIRVHRDQAKKVDMKSVNPIFHSNLDVKGLRKDLQNAAALDATKVHLLDVQLYHRNSIHAKNIWNYMEAPLFTTLTLGRLEAPFDGALEVYKRQLFYKFVHMTAEQAQLEADNLLATLGMDKKAARKAVERIYCEIKSQAKIRDYEQSHRQKLPLCPGPIHVEPAHEWVQQFWDKRKNKRNGVTGKEELAALIDKLERIDFD
ncbi:hypothetical protein ACEQ8H_003250 [Pleosporales sp. CAS-2024a]